MNKRKVIVLTASHAVALVAGFAGGIYALPILTAPPAPDAMSIEQVVGTREYVATFSRDRADSDPLHWGEGEVFLGPAAIALVGSISPGPDFRLYLSPEFVETEADFERLKPQMLQVGDVRTFENFLVPLPPGVDLDRYNTVIVWCESFGQFITSGRYRP